MELANQSGIPGTAEAGKAAPLEESWAVRHRAPIIALLIALGALPYLNTLLNAFVYDDEAQVLANPYLRSFRFLPQIFTLNVWSFRGQEGVSNYFRPMMTFGYLLCYKFFGPLAYGFHLANILLNVLVVLAIYMLTRRMFKNSAMAIAAASIFALHPIHTEDVAWIAAVTEIQVALFFILTFWFFFIQAREGGGRSERAHLGMVFCFILALMAKEQAMMTPLVAAVFEHFYRDDRNQTSWLQKLARYGDLWLLDLAYVLYRIRFLGAFAPIQWRAKMSWYHTILTAIALAGEYLVKLVWPVHLDAYYVFTKSTNLLDPRVVRGLAELSVCALIFVWLWKSHHLLSFGFIWMGLTLAPVLDARIMAGNVFTERYLYLPSVGFCWLVSWAGLELWRSFKLKRRGAALRWAMVSVLSAVGILACVKIFRRNRVWRDDMTLYKTTLIASPTATPILVNLGVTYWNMRDMKDTKIMWRRALHLDPHGPIILNDMGLIYLREKKYAEAAYYFKRAVRQESRFGDAHLNLGVCYRKMKRYDKADLQFRAAAALSPLLPSPHNQLGYLYLKEGNVQAAAKQYLLSVRDYGTYHGYDGLGDAELREGHPEVAERAYQAALKTNPFDHHAYFALAGLMAARGDRAAAIVEYRKGFETDPRNKKALAAYRRLTAHGSQIKSE